MSETTTTTTGFTDQLLLSGQQHLLKFHDQLPTDQKAQLEQDIRDFDWAKIAHIYDAQVRGHHQQSPCADANPGVQPTTKIDDNLLAPISSLQIEGTTRCNEEAIARYAKLGHSNIAQGKVAALLLAGGQGTRLGVDYPKGMYDIGLPNHKTLFQLQAERIRELEQRTGGEIIWYVMTSQATRDTTAKYFQDNHYFGLSPARFVLFEQNTMPCFDFDGKVLLADKHRISRSPNGNGGLFESLQERGILEHMDKNNVLFVHTYCVDNILVRICDPLFVGYCIDKQAQVGAKVVEKICPTESVGVICKVSDRVKVIEYSEISQAIAEKRHPDTDRLVFSAGNICEHFFTVDFLKSIQAGKTLPYHIALKKIPYIALDTGLLVKPEKPNGVKLEKFIFDVFELADKFVAWEVVREDEFSPLKNGPCSPKDNPSTALKAILRAYEKGILNV